MTMTMRILPLIALVLALAAPSWAQAQEGENAGGQAPQAAPAQSATGTITAHVLDFEGQPIQGARFMVESRTGDQTYEWTTGADGTLEQQLPVGEYSMRVVIRGVNIQEYERVRIDSGAVTEAEIDLSSLPGDTRAAIEEAWAERATDEAAVDAFTTGREALMAREYDRAIENFEVALQAQPTQHVIMANLAEAYNGARRYPEAIAQYQAALAIVPEEAVYHRNLASIYALAGEVDPAQTSVAEAARLDPPNAGRSYYQLGAAYLNTGRMTDATNAFQQAIDRDPELADAYYYLGIAYLGSTDTTSQAIPMMEKYLELAPDGPNAESARGIIAQVGGDAGEND